MKIIMVSYYYNKLNKRVLGEQDMQFLNSQYNLDNNSELELMLEKPTGWSSACLDSTASYYLDCNYTDLQLNEESTAEQKNN